MTYRGTSYRFAQKMIKVRFLCMALQREQVRTLPHTTLLCNFLIWASVPWKKIIAKDCENMEKLWWKYWSTNIIASWAPEHRLTALPTSMLTNFTQKYCHYFCPKKACFIFACKLMPSKPNETCLLYMGFKNLIYVWKSFWLLGIWFWDTIFIP